MATFSQEQVTKLLNYQAKSPTLRRVQVLAAVLLDTGLRVAEALALTKSDVDLDNLLIDVRLGKGRKQRKVPMSLELRRRLYLWLRGATGVYVFDTRLGVPLSIRNAQRDLTRLCKRAGITGVRTSPHTLRHTFACVYLSLVGTSNTCGASWATPRSSSPNATFSPSPHLISKPVISHHWEVADDTIHTMD